MKWREDMKPYEGSEGVEGVDRGKGRIGEDRERKRESVRGRIRFFSI